MADEDEPSLSIGVFSDTPLPCQLIDSPVARNAIVTKKRNERTLSVGIFYADYLPYRDK